MDVNRIGQGGPTGLQANNQTDTQNVTEPAKVKMDKTDEVSEESKSRGKSIKEEEIKKAVEKLNKFLEDKGTYAEYEVHDKFKKDIMIKIIDKNTKEVVREVPPKKILDMVAKMCELVGVLFDKKA